MVKNGIYDPEIDRTRCKPHYATFSERCGVKLDSERLNKKLQQWQKIAIAACEQCGRNRVPEIRPAMDLEAWCAEQDEGLKLNLHPRASNSINTLPL